MHLVVIKSLAVLLPLLIANISCAPVDNSDTGVHFGYDTENGQHRTEDIKFQSALNEMKSENDIKRVEYRGGYSFVSADGYEYTVLYKANKNGFQPYVTARKIVKSPDGQNNGNATTTKNTDTNANAPKEA